MDCETFVKLVIKEQIRDKAYGYTKEYLSDPEQLRVFGSPAEYEAFAKLSKYSKEEKEVILTIVRSSLHTCIFSFLAILDGVREFDLDGGKLVLSYRSEDGSHRNLLAEDGEDVDFLHDEYMIDYPDWLSNGE